MAHPHDNFLYRAALRAVPGRPLAGSVAASGRGLAIALPAAAVLPPLGLTAVPAALPLLGMLHLGLAVVAALTLAPALVAVAVAIRGVDALHASLDGSAGRAGRQSVWRIVMAGLLLAHALALAALLPAAGWIALCLAIAALALACGWLLLLPAILMPAEAAWRRLPTAALDAAALSAFLYAGGSHTAAWWPLYVYLAVDNALRFGVAALAVAAVSSVAGFALVVAATPFWRQQPLLAGGLIAALVLLPAYLAPAIRVAARGARAVAAKGRLLNDFADELRAPLETIARALDRSRGDPAAQRTASMLLARLDDLRDLAAVENAEFDPADEPFDLHHAVNEAVAAVRARASEQGTGLSLRIDPHLPYRLHGPSRQFSRMLFALLADAVASGGAGEVRVAVDQRRLERDGVRIAVAIRTPAPVAAEGTAQAILARLAGAMGGGIACRAAPGGGGLVVLELPFAIDRSASAEALDLRQRPVFLVGADPALIETLSSLLIRWGGDPHALGTPEEAVERLRRTAADTAAPVVIVDGRSEALPALSFVHRAVTAGLASPSAILLIAERPRIASLIGLAERDVAGVLPAPIAEAVLANALHALPEPETTAAAPAAPPASGGQSARASPPPQRRLRILVADDDAASRKIIERVLEVAGHMVVLAGSGREALAALAEGRVDVALIDLNMPGLSGDETARRHRAAYAGPPILGLTADSGREVEQSCRAAGMDGVLQKPIEPSRLIAAVEAAAAEANGEPATVVTRIAAHPRFAADNAAVVDEETIDALRALAAGSDFFRDVVDAFRHDAQEILQRIGRAAAVADTPRFKDAVHELKSCAANVGGRRLCELLSSMHDTTARELRRDGGQLVQRLGAEFARLDTALLDYCEGGEATRH